MQLKIYLLFSYLSLSKFIAGRSYEEDVTLTDDQKETLEKFKERMKPLVKNDVYKSKDTYLLRWLRATNFAVDGAEAILRQDIDWRKQERMDEILKENWTDLNEQLPYTVDSVDKTGKPLLLMEYYQWDIRAAQIAVGTDRLNRYMRKYIEHSESRVKEEQSKGKNVTRFQAIVDVSGFSMVQQGCLQCLQVYTKIATTVVTHYPHLIDHIFVVNSPQMFSTVLNIIRPIFSQEYGMIMQVFSGTVENWGPTLFEHFDKDQIPIKLGGSKPST